MIIYLFQKNGKYFLGNKIFNIFLISLILFTIDFIDVFRNNYFDPKYKKIKEFEESHSKTFIENFFINPTSDMKKFRDINNKNILLDNVIFTKNEYPDVSVIITVYNQAHCFHSALRSVQNQSLKNIEIIIIDDCSSDDSIKVIEKYMKEDRRIIFLKHESNDGQIKSRSDGIRIAKGKYITIIDGDDSLSNKNILYNCVNIANSANLDVVGFNYAFFVRKHLMKINNYKNIKNLNNRIIYQPELSFKFVDFDKKDSIEGFANRNIWAKLIKNEIFKKVIDYIGPKYTGDYIIQYEDTIMSVSLFRVAKSYYYMRECGYYYAKEECEKKYFPISNIRRCKPKNFRINTELDPIKYLNFLLDKYGGKEIENYLLYKELISIDYYKNLENLIENNFSYVYSIIEKINKLNFHYNQRKNRLSKIIHRVLKSNHNANLK